MLLVRRISGSDGGGGKKRQPSTIGETLTTYRHSMVANSVLEVATDGTKKKKMKKKAQDAVGGVGLRSAGRLGYGLPVARRATINKSRGMNSLEVVASTESKYFEAMEGDVLEEHVLVYEGAGMYAIPLDTDWVDPNPTLHLFEALPPANSGHGDPDVGLDSVDHAFGSAAAAAFPFDFAESEQMVSTSFAAMGGATGTAEYLDVLGDGDEYLDVVGKEAGDNHDEYLEVDGNDVAGEDNDFFSVLSALAATGSASLDDDTDIDADEYLEVAGEAEEEAEDEADGGVSFSKPAPGRLKNIWAPTGAIRAPKMVFRKGSAWKAGATKVVAVNAFKQGSCRLPPPAPKRHGSGESTVDDMADEEPPPLLPRLLPKPARLLTAAAAVARTAGTPAVLPGMLDGLTMLPVVEMNDGIAVMMGDVASRYQPAGMVRAPERTGAAARYKPAGMVQAPSFVIRRLSRSSTDNNADEEL